MMTAINADKAMQGVALACLMVIILVGTSCRNYNCSWEDMAPHAKLTKPEGEGPFPAVVLLHGCGGMVSSYPHKWDLRLAEWGYVSLQVDSLTPRKISSICAGGMIAMEMLSHRVKDAYLARDYLATLDFVDADRIGVMGWSHGGTTAVKAVITSGEPKRTTVFNAAAAFYPTCYKSIDPQSPLLILSGGKDRWTPLEFCLRHAPVADQTDMFKLEIYPEAYHCFDWVGIDTKQRGYILRYHPESASDAYVKVRSFFGQNLATVHP